MRYGELKRLAGRLCFGGVAAMSLAAWGQQSVQQPGQPTGQPGQHPDTSDLSRHVWIKTPVPEDWTRHFRVGVLVGLNVKANFRINGSFGGGGNAAGAPGTYDDGYVRDDQTGNAGGYTTYWGYENASQYDAASQKLFMHNSVVTDSSARGSDDMNANLGAEMEYGGYLRRFGRARVGWELGIGIMPISAETSLSAQGSATQNTYSFDTGGIEMPGAPYHGSANPSGSAWAIHSTPHLEGSSNVVSTIHGTEKLDVMFYTLRLGPSVYWDLAPRWGASAGAGPALGIVSGDYKFNEGVAGSNQKTKGTISETDVVFGGYLSGTIMYHAQNNGDLYLGVQYMPMGDAKFSGAGREATLKLGGAMYLSAGFNWPF